MDKSSFIEVGMKNGARIMCKIAESFFFDGCYYVYLEPGNFQQQRERPFFMKVIVEGEHIFFKMVEEEHQEARIRSFLSSPYDKKHPFKGASEKELYRILITDVELWSRFNMDDVDQDISVVYEMVSGCKKIRYLVNHHRKKAYELAY